MATYWISFRIGVETTGKGTWQQRYNAFTDELGELSRSSWDETTSFLVFSSGYNIAQIGTQLRQHLSRKHDVFLIRELERKSARVYGTFTDDYNGLYDLMDYVIDITD